MAVYWEIYEERGSVRHEWRLLEYQCLVFEYHLPARFSQICETIIVGHIRWIPYP